MNTTLPLPIADTAPTLSGSKRARHGFFTRCGGVSTGLYQSLNCGIGSLDDRDAVLDNRQRVARALGAAGGVVTAHQVHSAVAAVADQPFAQDARPKADALVTSTPGLVIGVLTADCAPVLFVDEEAGVIGCAHAGWRGALDGILASTVTAMEGLGASRRRINAALGPCIGPGAYEVGPEFEATFVSHTADFARFFHRPAGAARQHFDLPAFVIDRLEQLQLGGVESRHRCTYETESDYFSFRRSTHRKEADYGRQISAIVLG